MKCDAKIIAYALLLMLLGGCAVAPMATVEQDTKAKAFTPLPDRASLYIYRNEVFGAAIPISIAVNGKMLGQTAAQTYFWLNLRPGKYNIESHAENASSLAVNLEAGKNYYVWQEVKMGFWMARSLLQEVDENTGRGGVSESKLIMTTLGENDVLPLDASHATTTTSPALGQSTAQRLRELEGLRKDGIITEDEYRKTRQQLLEKL